MAGSMDLVVKLLVDDDGIGRGLSSAEQKIRGFSADSAASIGAGGSIAVLGGLAVGALGAADAAVEAEESQQRFQYALDQFPRTADVSAAALMDLNSALATKTRFDDDAIASGQAVLAQFDLTGGQIQELTPLLLDYAAKTGQDVPTAADALGKAMLGQGKALKQVGIDFTDTGSLGGNYEAVVAGLTEKVGGFAEVQGEGAAGSAAIFKNSLGELMETLGTGLLPIMADFAQKGAEFAQWAQENAGLVQGVAIVTGILAGAVLLASGAYKGMLLVQGLATLFGVLRGATVAGTAATTANTTAVAANNVAWYASPVTWIIGLIVLAIVALVAAGIWLVSNWDGVVKWFGEAWANISNGASAAFDWVVGVWGGFAGWWGDMWSGAGRVFEDVWGNVVSFVKDWVVNPILYAIEFMVNGVIWMINRMVDGINAVAGWTGLRLGYFNTVSIPKLAAGGVVTSATLALVGEAGPEAVVPLDRWEQANSDRSENADGDTVVHNVLTLDGRTVYEATERHRRKRR